MAITVAFIVWNLAKDGAPLCDPDSLVQGHAVCHLLSAVSVYCLYRYWSSIAAAHASAPRPAAESGS